MMSPSVSIMRRILTVASKRAILPKTSYYGRVVATKAHLSTNAFAVDSPDGDVDGRRREEMVQVSTLINDAAALETGILRERILEEHATEDALAKDGLKIFAVDSPDGDSDGHVGEEMEEIKHIINDASEMEKGEVLDQILRRHKLEEDVAKEHARDPEHDW